LKKPFDENADKNLSAVVHFQCRIFKRLTLNYKIITSCGAFCRTDYAVVSNLILTIRSTASCDIWNTRD